MTPTSISLAASGPQVPGSRQRLLSPSVQRSSLTASTCAPTRVSSKTGERKWSPPRHMQTPPPRGQPVASASCAQEPSGQTAVFPCDCKVIYVQGAKSYRFQIPADNSVRDSVAYMTEQITNTAGLRAKRVTTTTIPPAVESVTITEWSCQNTSQPPLLLMEAVESDDEELAEQAKRVPASSLVNALCTRLNEQAAILRNQAQHIKELQQRHRIEAQALAAQLADVRSKVTNLEVDLGELEAARK